MPIRCGWPLHSPGIESFRGVSSGAIDSAIKYRNTVASVGRPTSATFEPWETYRKVIEYDIQRWEEYNLNPNLNKGNQISKLIAWTINDINEMKWLIQQGVSGIITDDIAMMKSAVAAAS
jgi:glycerophosphoryl diester phosphodiesterase